MPSTVRPRRSTEPDKKAYLVVDLDSGKVLAQSDSLARACQYRRIHDAKERLKQRRNKP